MKITIIAPTQIPTRRANTLQVMKMAQAFVILGHEIRLIVPAVKKVSQEVIPDWN
jgi:hypothetical protein